MNIINDNQRYLIINADDFGMCHAFNDAIIQMHQDGIVTSASLMCVCPWYTEATEYALQSQMDIGVHVTLNSEWSSYRWRSLSPSATLLDAAGYLPNTIEAVTAQAQPSDVLAEVHAQINKIQHSLIQFTHMDSHMGTLNFLPGRHKPWMMEEILDICAQHRIPFRLPAKLYPRQMPDEILPIYHHLVDYAQQLHLPMVDHIAEYPFDLLDGETYHSFQHTIIDILRNLRPGVTELCLHPSVESDEIKAITPRWHKRVMEYRVFYEDAVQKTLDTEGIQLIPWSTLQ